MPDRVIKDRIKSSRDLAKLSDFSFRLWIHVLTETDGLGRFEADPQLICGRSIPYLARSVEDVVSAMEEWGTTGLARFYHVDGRDYGEFPTFALYQKLRHRTKRFPDVPGSADDRRRTTAEEKRSRREVEVEVEEKKNRGDSPRGQKKPVSKKSRSSSPEQPVQELIPTPTAWDQLNERLRKHVTAITPGLSAHGGAGWEETSKEWLAAARAANSKDKGPKREELLHALDILLDEPESAKFRWATKITNMRDLIRHHAKIIASREDRVKKDTRVWAVPGVVE